MLCVDVIDVIDVVDVIEVIDVGVLLIGAGGSVDSAIFEYLFWYRYWKFQIKIHRVKIILM